MHCFYCNIHIAKTLIIVRYLMFYQKMHKHSIANDEQYSNSTKNKPDKVFLPYPAYRMHFTSKLFISVSLISSNNTSEVFLL